MFFHKHKLTIAPIISAFSLSLIRIMYLLQQNHPKLFTLLEKVFRQYLA